MNVHEEFALDVLRSETAEAVLMMPSAAPLHEGIPESGECGLLRSTYWTSSKTTLLGW
jgi:hypothetical protein